MNKIAYIALAAVPALVAPAAAQDQKITVSDYIETQMAILKGMNELLTIQGVAEAPGDLVPAVAQLTQYASALANLKSQLDAGELAAAQAELENDAEAQAIGHALTNSLNVLIANNFYNSKELAAVIQSFLTALSKM